MTKYYFNFTDGKRVYPDVDGVELADPGLVSEEAINIGMALAKELEGAGVDCARWSVEVLGSANSPVLCVPLPPASRACSTS